MISSISSWAEQIVIAVIIGTIIEMLLPKGNNKKYIKTIIGVYILYTIIAPIISNFASGFEIDLAQYEEYFESNEVNSVDLYSINDIYEEEIIKQMTSDIEEMEFIVNNISMDFNIDVGKIESVSLSITKAETQEENNTISINKISIGNSTNNYENDLTKQEIEKIKEFISEEYGVEYENIIINSL